MRLINPDFKVAGLASCAHRYLKHMSVIDYAESMQVNQLATEKIKKLQRKPDTSVVTQVTPVDPAEVGDHEVPKLVERK